MFVDDLGHRKALSVNERATVLYGSATGWQIRGDVIVSACELDQPLPHEVVDLLLDDDSFLSVIPADDFVRMCDDWPLQSSSSSQKRDHDRRRVDVDHSSPVRHAAPRAHVPQRSPTRTRRLEVGRPANRRRGHHRLARRQYGCHCDLGRAAVPSRSRAGSCADGSPERRGCVQVQLDPQHDIGSRRRGRWRSLTTSTSSSSCDRTWYTPRTCGVRGHAGSSNTAARPCRGDRIAGTGRPDRHLVAEGRQVRARLRRHLVSLSGTSDSQRHHSLPGLFRAPGRIRTCDARFGKPIGLDSADVVGSCSPR